MSVRFKTCGVIGIICFKGGGLIRWGRAADVDTERHSFRRRGLPAVSAAPTCVRW
jgi:hypothetical protein